MIRAWELLGNIQSRGVYDTKLRALRQDAIGAKDVTFEDLTVEDASDVMEFLYQCRCSDYYSIDSLELGMNATQETGYNPPSEFEKDTRDPLIELDLTDSTELWLIQWPKNELPDIHGLQVSLNLHSDGCLGRKSYDLVSFASQNADATVFVSSASEAKVAGKISRRVSLVHYPDPNELEQKATKDLKQMYEMSSTKSRTHSSLHFGTSSQGKRQRPSKSGSTFTTSTHISGRKRLFSEKGESSKAPTRGHVERPTWSTDLSAQDSGRGHSAAPSSRSLEHSQQQKLKKKKKIEG
ncbi:hypothetical protein RJ639_019182 [Escallonia herrerae]|uniref:Uncharacterized protein n=1 Tax=Escallonia herrerae TaxID=1293975 RepID=A0AA88V789_9ASTE|nr:hypothetical protein RJ639_019182 [Escallonia herrerae]